MIAGSLPSLFQLRRGGRVGVWLGRTDERPFQIFEHAIDEGVDFVGRVGGRAMGNPSQQLSELFPVHGLKIEQRGSGGESDDGFAARVSRG